MSAERDALLRARAERLARLPEDPGGSQERRPALVFELSGRRFAIESAWVARVTVPNRLTPLPRPPVPFVGVANLDGEVVPLIDAAALLGTEPVDLSGPLQCLVLAPGDDPVGLLIDRAAEIIDLADEDSDRADASAREWAIGFTPSGILLLDGERICGDPRLRPYSEPSESEP